MSVEYSKPQLPVKKATSDRVLEGEAESVRPAFGMARIRVEKAEEKRIEIPGEASDQPGSHAYLEERGSVRYPLTAGLYGEAYYNPGDEVFINTSEGYKPIRLPDSPDGHVRLLVRMSNIFGYKSNTAHQITTDVGEE